MSLLKELKRRNVFRVAIAYIVVLWAVLQGADFMLDLAEAPNWVMRVFAIAGLIGFPFALFFAWAYELTPEGIKREEEVDRSEQVTRHTGNKLNFVIIGLLLLVIALLGARQLFFADGAAPVAQPATTVATPSVAVLPFVNMSADPNNEYFSEGVAEEILNVLARIPELKVSARTSAFSYKDSDATIAEIAKELGVNHVLEGSVRKAGDRVRVTAQLIEANNEFHLWSETYDRKLNDIFAIQDEIAQAIAAQLKVHLLPQAEQPNQTGTTDLEAYQLYLRGVNQWHLRTGESLENALSLFEQATRLDPDFTRAWGYLALTWSVIADYTDRPLEQTNPAALTAADTALKLDPTSVEAATALINPSLADSPEDIEALIEKGDELLARKPGFATAYQWHATNLVSAGRVEDAISYYRAALELDPHALVIHQNLGILLTVLGRFEEAQALLRNVERLAPDYWDGAQTRFLLYLLSGQRDAAQREGERLVEILGRTRDTVPLYLDLMFASERRDAAISEILTFQRDGWWGADNPSLIEAYALPILLTAVGAYDEALAVMISNHEEGGDDFGVTHMRINKLAGDFNCRADVTAFYDQLGLPRLPDCPSVGSSVASVGSE
jgi:TolB-like protein